MIIMALILLSLVAVYFIRILSMKKMKVASLSVAVLYIYIVVWAYAIFIIDIADLGFADIESRIALLHGSNIYHSFIALTTKMSVIPLPILKTIVGVAGMILVAACIVAFHGIFEITRAVISVVKTKELFVISKDNRKEFRSIFEPQCEKKIIRMHCRMNC